MALNNRNYNIIFHLHTVSGIVISVLLFVIFFAGSFSFFRDEIVNWERNDKVVSTEEITIDLDTAIDSIQTTNKLLGRDISLKKYYEEDQVNVTLSASKNEALKDEAASFFYLNTKDYSTTTYQDSYTLGEFLYRLHFFAQIAYPYGYWLSGFTAFFFLFALITGIVIHWDKIVSNFYVFRPKAKLKTVWTDAHTLLGTISFPFQFVYAVTGAFFMIKTLIVAPNVFALFNGDNNKLFDALEYNAPTYEYTNNNLEKVVHFNQYLYLTKKQWPNFHINKIDIYNFGDENMHVNIEGNLPLDKKFTGIGQLSFYPSNNSSKILKNPYTENGYLDGVKNSLYRLHFGDYAGYPLRIISFILGIFGCVVILSGVLIWFNARNKKNITEKNRKFNNSVLQVYLAICLSMYPATALSFIAVKLIGSSGMSFIYYFYFLVWLILSVFYSIKNNTSFTTKNTLLLGSIFGILIPFINGYISGNWFWLSFTTKSFHIFFIDAFWLLLGFISFFSYLQIQKK